MFLRFDDVNGCIKKAGESVGVETVLGFGWWRRGMDNGYPDSYWVTDPAQGGDAAWAKAIADDRKNGGRFMLYFNSKLIDRESAFYPDRRREKGLLHGQYRRAIHRAVSVSGAWDVCRTSQRTDVCRRRHAQRAMAQAAAEDGRPRHRVRRGQRVL